MDTVAVVDYGMGNLRSVAQALRRAAAGAPVAVVVTHRPEEVVRAARIVLPGQGAMPECMRELAASGLLEPVLEAAANKPLLGVCVGMQMLLERSEEGDTPALGLFRGTVRRFRLEGRQQEDGSRFKVPQMGWNQVWQSRPHPLWAGIPDGAWFYFVHSYYAAPEDPAESAATAVYGARFTAALARANIFATQFHPEKSAAAGLTLYRNFLHWCP